MWPAALETEPARAVLDRATPFRGYTLRLLGIPESEIAKTLREVERDIDLSALEITTCLRGGELEVDVRHRDGAEAGGGRRCAGRSPRATPASCSARTGARSTSRSPGCLRGRRVGLAESCSGGLLAARLTGAAGRLGVRRRRRRRLLERGEGGAARRRPRADRAPRRRLARGRRGDGRRRAGAVRRRRRASRSPGSPAPTGGTEEKPVGYVCFCAKLADGRSLARDPVIPGGRDDIRERSALVGDAHAANPARRRGAAAVSRRRPPEPFEISVAEEVLDDLRERLAAYALAGSSRAERGMGARRRRRLPARALRPLGRRVRLARLRVAAERALEPPLERPAPDLGAEAEGEALPVLLLHGWPGGPIEFLDADPAARRGRARRRRALAARLRVVRRPGPAAQRRRGRRAPARAGGGRPGLRALRGPGRRLGRDDRRADRVRLAGARRGAPRQRRLGAARSPATSPTRR